MCGQRELTEKDADSLHRQAARPTLGIRELRGRGLANVLLEAQIETTRPIVG